MQVKILDEVREVQVTTVTLGPDWNDKLGLHVYMFHCLRCGEKLIQHRGEIIETMPGFIPRSLPLILMCHNPKCKHRYMFRDITTVI